MFDFLTLFDEYLHNLVPGILFIALLAVTFLLYQFTLDMTRSRRKKWKKVPLLLYIAALLMLFVLCRQGETRGIRLLGYVQDMGVNRERMELGPVGFAVDAAAFFPLGYLVRWQRHRTHWVSMLLTILAVGVGVELLQFAAARGCIGVSDLAAYLLGGFCGLTLRRLQDHGGRFHRRRHKLPRERRDRA